MMKLYTFGSNACGQLGTGSLQDISSPLHVLNEQVIDIDGGSNHTVFITKNSVFATGSNSKGQIGFSTSFPHIDKFQQLTLPVELNGQTFKSVICGWETTSLIMENGNGTQAY